MFKYIWLFVALLMPVVSVGSSLVEGKDYKKLSSEDKIQGSGGIVNVSEFFSYGCPWCYRLEGPVAKWVKQQDGNIFFSRVPVVFHPDWVYYAKAYYIVDALSLGSKFSDDLFKAIIVDKKRLNSDQQMIDFFVSHGVAKDVAESSFMHSPSIDMRLNDDAQTLARYQISGVPTFVVNGQYEVNLLMAKTEDHLFEILSALVDMAQNGQSKQMQVPLGS